MGDDTPWIAYGSADDDFFNSVERYLEQVGLTQRVVVRVTHIETIKHLVLEGVGAAILPDYTVRDSRFATADVPQLALRQPVWAAQRHGSPRTQALDRWVEGLRSHFSE